jgi:hypothetical protein
VRFARERRRREDGRAAGGAPDDSGPPARGTTTLPLRGRVGAKLRGGVMQRCDWASQCGSRGRNPGAPIRPSADAGHPHPPLRGDLPPRGGGRVRMRRLRLSSAGVVRGGGCELQPHSWHRTLPLRGRVGAKLRGGVMQRCGRAGQCGSRGRNPGAPIRPSADAGHPHPPLRGDLPPRGGGRVRMRRRRLSSGGVVRSGGCKLEPHSWHRTLPLRGRVGAKLRGGVMQRCGRASRYGSRGRERRALICPIADAGHPHPPLRGDLPSRGGGRVRMRRRRLSSAAGVRSGGCELEPHS